MSGEAVARTLRDEHLHPYTAGGAPPGETAETGSDAKTSKDWTASYRTRQFFFQFKIGLRRSTSPWQAAPGSLPAAPSEREAAGPVRNIPSVAAKPYQAPGIPPAGDVAGAYRPAPSSPDPGGCGTETAVFMRFDIGTTVSPPDPGQPPNRDAAM
jgi:hypothetical protein